LPTSPQFIEALGPYAKHAPVQAFCDISKNCFELFHESIGGHERQRETPREHLTTRMLYISEATSSAIRLSVTWALSLPAMSLVRNRYEQVVRHSWLMHQSDNAEMVKYLGFHYAKASKVYSQLDEATRNELLRMNVDVDEWLTEKLTKEQRHYLERWEKLDLESMVKKRDTLLNDDVPCRAQRELADLYTPVYRQFSSVSHFDMYSMNMLGLHKSPNGLFVLAPDPWWPAILCLYTSLLDLIHCSEASKLAYRVDRQADWASLFDRWRGYRDRVIDRREHSADEAEPNAATKE